MTHTRATGSPNRRAGPPKRASGCISPLGTQPPSSAGPEWAVPGGRAREGDPRRRGGAGLRPGGMPLPPKAPESCEPRAALNNSPRRGCPEQCPVPHPAILLTGHTLPPFLATPDPISNVYSEPGAGLAAGLGQSLPESPPHPVQLLRARGGIRARAWPKPTLPGPWLFPGWPRWRSPGGAAGTRGPVSCRAREKRWPPHWHLWLRIPAPD